MRAQFEKISADASRSFRVEERRINAFDAPWHFHPEIELTLILESRGRRFVGDSIEPFSEGDFVLLGSNLPHFWHTEGPQPPRSRAHSLVVQFQNDFLGAEIWTRPELLGIRRLLDDAARGLRFSGPMAQEAAGRMRRLPGLVGLAALAELLAVFDLLGRVRSARPLASAAYEPSLDRHGEKRLARVYSFLMRNFREPLSLERIARVAAMTPSAFSRYFKRATGRNVFVLLRELRVDCAGRLLRETERRVVDIAGESGFASLSSFNRRFREKTGCTPLECRRAFQDKSTPSPVFVPRRDGILTGTTPKRVRRRPAGMAETYLGHRTNVAP